MWYENEKRVFARLAIAALVLFVSAAGQAQGPYGLAARQTIPWVVDDFDDRGMGWATELNIHNPNPVSIRVEVTFKGAVGSATTGSRQCISVILAAGETAERRLWGLCQFALNPGRNFGRLELTSLLGGSNSSPSDAIFMANARLYFPGRAFFTVEGFPEGNLSGNRFAVVTGLKSDPSNTQWRSVCRGAALNDPTGVNVRLFDGTGNPIGNVAGAPLDPPNGLEMQTFDDVFTAVGAPPANYENVTALFSSTLGAAGPGIFAFCILNDVPTGERAFTVAKYLDNHDEGRQYVTDVNETAYGAAFEVSAEIKEYRMTAWSNLHVAYFQHPDRIHCNLFYGGTTGGHNTFDGLQMRLIDPEGTEVVRRDVMTGMDFRLDLEEKPVTNRGRNGRWVIEVGPDRAYLGDCDAGDLWLRECQPSKVERQPYRLVCSSGNGHNQLDPIGHCVLDCTKDPMHSGEARCTFSNPPCWP